MIMPYPFCILYPLDDSFIPLGERLFGATRGIFSRFDDGAGRFVAVGRLPCPSRGRLRILPGLGPLWPGRLDGLRWLAGPRAGFRAPYWLVIWVVC